MSAPRNPNSRALGALVAELVPSGVRDACISPGSRSTAAVLALARAPGLRTWMITDERSAAFAALGMARATRRPVVLLSTSGTAAANYLPAIVEAALAHVPLVVLTADRPPELRDCDAPQTIDQVRLFGSHVRWSVDAPTPADGLDLDDYYRRLACRAVATAVEAPGGPVHVNLPMREPLVDVDEERAAARDATTCIDADASGVDDTCARDGSPRAAGRRATTVVYAARALPAAPALAELAQAFARTERGVVVCGPDAAGDGGVDAIVRLAARCGWPVLADPLSGARFGRHDRHAVVDAYDVLLRDPEFRGAHRPELVLQLGRPAVSATLQRFVAGARARHVVVAPPGTWPDPLQRATDVVRAAAGDVCAALADLVPTPPPRAPWLDAWRAAAAAARAAVDGQLARADAMHEGTILARLCAILPDGAALHVGNSLPVRALDAFVGGAERALTIACNRGANGIDGVLSTALGAAAVRPAPTALVVGDLSFLHDVGGLQLAARHRVSLLVVVVHNDGGAIFSLLPQARLGDEFERLFLTPHGLALAGAVEMCGGRHVVATSADEVARAARHWLEHRGLTVVEARCERARAVAAHAALAEAAASWRAGAPARAGR